MQMHMHPTVHAAVRTFHAGRKKIARECRAIANLQLVNLERNVVYSNETFVQVQNDYREKQVRLASAAHAAIVGHARLLHRGR